MAGELEGRKLIAVGGSSGMGRAAAVQVVEGGGSAVIIDRDQARVTDTVDTIAAKGRAWGITADLADREQADAVGAEPEHRDCLQCNPDGYVYHFVRPEWVLSEKNGAIRA